MQSLRPQMPQPVFQMHITLRCISGRRYYFGGDLLGKHPAQQPRPHSHLMVAVNPGVSAHGGLLMGAHPVNITQPAGKGIAFGGCQGVGGAVHRQNQCLHAVIVGRSKNSWQTGQMSPSGALLLGVLGGARGRAQAEPVLARGHRGPVKKLVADGADVPIRRIAFGGF